MEQPFYFTETIFMIRKFAICFLGSMLLTEFSLAQSPEPSSAKREKIFDSTVDASKQIHAALAKSRKENRRVLIQWGSDDSPECIAFNKSLAANRDIGKTLRYEYDVVRVEVNESAKNRELAMFYGKRVEGVKFSLESLPFLTVLDTAGKTVENETGRTFITEQGTAPEVSQEGVLDFLTKHQAKPLDANVLLQKAIAQGTTEKKNVFLHFGAPWCGWCHIMEDWMSEPTVAAILGKVFVDLKVDTDRMIGGPELLDTYCKKQGGIPWFAFVSTENGSVVIDSDGPSGNIGFPSTDEEIEYFVSMLQATKGFSDEDIQSLNESLIANRKARESKSRKL